MEIDLPDVIAEVTEAFAKYEAALVGNDVAMLDDLFHVDARTLRYGIGRTSMVMRRSRVFVRPVRPSGWRAPPPAP